MSDECYSHFTYGRTSLTRSPALPARKTRHHHRLHVQNFRHDRLAHRLHPRARTADAGHDQVAEPIDIEPDFDLAIRRAGSDARLHGFRARDARRIHAAAKRIVDGLREITGVTCEGPGGAFYAFPNMSAHLTGSNALAKSWTELTKLLLEKVGSRSSQAKRSARPDTCASPTRLRSSVSTKDCAASAGFSRAEAASKPCRPRSDAAPTRIAPILVPRIWGAHALAPCTPKKQIFPNLSVNLAHGPLSEIETGP